MFKVKFEGGQAMAANLAQLSTRLSKRILIESLTEAAEPMRRSMAQRAPYEPGKPDLRDTMTISTSRGADVREAAVAVGPNRSGYYGSFQEFGTARHGAQPFARPAFDENVQKSLQILGAAIWRELAGKGLNRPMVISDGPVMGEEV